MSYFNEIYNDPEQNRATKAAVEAIKSKRIIELTHSKAGLKKTSVRSKMLDRKSVV